MESNRRQKKNLLKGESERCATHYTCAAAVVKLSLLLSLDLAFNLLSLLLQYIRALCFCETNVQDRTVDTQRNSV